MNQGSGRGDAASDDRTDEKLAVVTGTSSGIGAALVDALIARGWTVAGLARRDVRRERGYEHFQIDLDDLAALEEIVERRLGPLVSQSRWERVGLVNNAALAGTSRGLEHAPPREIDRLLRVNTVAPMFLMGFVARTAPADVPLRIVNVSSGAAGRGIPGLAEYCASKAGLRLAGMAFAEELSSPLRPGGGRRDAAVLSYEPGVVDTPMQVAARSGKGAEAPWNDIFVRFHQEGMLQPAAAVVGEVVHFLESGHAAPFAELRASAK